MATETQETIQIGKGDLKIICTAITNRWYREHDGGKNSYFACIHCGISIISYKTDPNQIKHENDCPYLVARGISDSCGF